MATSTNKTAAFAVKLIHKCMSKHRYIQKNRLFGALYGLVESFFKNDEGHNVTVNGDRYRAMITNFFIPELNNHDVQELWFQQDGITCHTARATIDLLKDTLGDRLISRFGPVSWPPRSCDLTPLDYFLWGYVKNFLFSLFTNSPFPSPLQLKVRPQKPIDYGHELMVGVSRVRTLVPLKINLVEGLMLVKSVKAQSPPIGVMR
ncbi:transposable element Tc3 transposase [Trichonephila clavipes]|nr:transposable element Tc3 transposase [Trichonephila clavipes]